MIEARTHACSMPHPKRAFTLMLDTIVRIKHPNASLEPWNNTEKDAAGPTDLLLSFAAPSQQPHLMTYQF